MAELGNPLKVLKKLELGTKNLVWSSNLEHIIYKNLYPDYIVFFLIQMCPV